jgi:hypothetical protein
MPYGSKTRVYEHAFQVMTAKRQKAKHPVPKRVENMVHLAFPPGTPQATPEITETSDASSRPNKVSLCNIRAILADPVFRLLSRPPNPGM